MAKEKVEKKAKEPKVATNDIGEPMVDDEKVRDGAI